MDDRIRKALVAVLEEPYRDYWAALGRFIHEFSAVENTLRALVLYHAGVEDKIGRAVFHGLRVDNAKDTVNRILEAKGDHAAKARLEDPFAQLGVIASMRNNIVHWGAELADEAGLRVSNRRLAITPDRVRSYTVSAEHLGQMQQDLLRIHTLFMMEIYGHPDPAIYESNFAETVRAQTWLYKQPQPAPRPKTRDSRATPRPRKRRHDA